MARTPLMRAMQQLASEHAEAAERGISVEEVRQQRRIGISRRQLLKGAGALAAGIALADPLGLTGKMLRAEARTAPRIAIIGAGIAGLNAALTLHDAGYASTVYEASSSVGGRMHSNTTTWANDQTSEWCGELIDTAHTSILALAQRFGLKAVDIRAAEPEGSQNTNFFFGKYYLQSQVDKDFQPVFQVLQSQNQAAPTTTYNNFNAAGEKLDHTSLYNWIEQFVPGGHSSNMGQLLDVAYNIEFGRETKEQSSLNLVYLLGAQPTTGGFEIFGSSDERFHIMGGNQQVPQAIADFLPDGAIKFRWRMTAIEKTSSDGIKVIFSTLDGTQQQNFDRVILTLPFSVLRTLDYSEAGFTSLKKTAITQLGYGTNAKLQLQFDTRFWNRTGPWPGISTGNIYTDVGFQNTWDVTRGQAGATGIIVDYTGGEVGAAFHPAAPYTTSADPKTRDYAQTFLHQLEKVWPGISSHYIGKATLSSPTLDPNLRGSYSCWLVGQYTSFAGYEGVRQGNIHFAGEHCSLNFQGFMEGGAEEGARAAQEILNDYKKNIFP
ncbi:MAG TPA: NAD(P)/FAD-dependent oxidoreductase [Ktedonosporobacter sp.]|nr:NAD(P)/FAD-dependent oxidoreductase [Ktedonosporobacter sp.]